MAMGKERYDVSYTQDLSCSVNNLGLVRWSEIRMRDAGTRTSFAIRDQPLALLRTVTRPCVKDQGSDLPVLHSSTDRGVNISVIMYNDSL